ncbi:S-adenosyl-L-methionine-dependent methyltransferase [Amanita rubescens]|nr:S-adenosyl-L-methionine-dependent methyltransferase [Amanita rubescens]
MSIKSLLALLAARIGAAQAEQEYKWLKQAVPRVSDLVTMIRRRTLGEPLQYILGSQPFGPLNLLTRAPVLIPRPETEHWVIKLSQYISPPAQSAHRLLDLGTGTGCIPLLLCHLSPPGSIHAIGVDISDHAIQLADENAAICANVLDVNFHHHPGISLPIDILTSNPPYITWQDYLKLPYSVSAFEDPKALFGGPSGLEFYRAIARFISLDGCLSPGALVALEVGHGQARDVEDLLQKTGRMKRTEIWPDPWGKERTVVGHTT